MEKKAVRVFTSQMTKREIILALLWLPVHLFVMPKLAMLLMDRGIITESLANLLVYGIGAIYIVITCYGFLRRDFDPLCDDLLGCIAQIALCYCMMMAFNLCASGILSGLETMIGQSSAVSNLNNEAILDMAKTDTQAITAMAVFLAPLTEEVLFRGAIFGGIRKTNRIAAYAVSMVLFSVYHIWGYAIEDPSYWLYTLQYLPAAFLLCRCYERTNSIWCSIFFHMLVNHISMKMLMLLEELL
ncbi:MAG: CPBP family intramembrane metalloprotease [Oscillospiraceae bacterium]|nr:CPBP family intramembrane metalloprotease [Oscillospiraceae bacterium]